MTKLIKAALAALLGRAAPAPTESAPAVDAASVAAAEANAFGADLYRALAPRGGNLLISPINISAAFAMAQAGAAGETAAQMATVFHRSLPPGQTSALLEQLGGEWDGGQVLFANRLWLQDGFHLHSAFEQAMAETHGAGLERVNFEGAPEPSKRAINQWIEDRTAGRIRDMLPKPPEGPLVITSALYLKAAWAAGFWSFGTKVEDFHAPEGVVPAPLMNATLSLRYLEGPDFKAVALPYRGERLSMALIVPDRNDGLGELEQSLDGARLNGWLAALRTNPRREIVLTLPKFSFDDGAAMKPLLSRLGMGVAFTDKADFSNLSEAPLKIGEARARTFISVDEAGTEAAATTTNAVVRTTFAVRQTIPPVVVRADHPFLFAIFDEATGAVLFLGRLVRP